MELLSRAFRLRDLDHYQTLLAIAHNPYSKTAAEAKKLGRVFEQAEQGLRSGKSRGSEALEGGGIRVADLYKKFGPFKRVELKPDDWDKVEAEREAASLRARAKGMQVPVYQRRPFPVRAKKTNGDVG